MIFLYSYLSGRLISSWCAFHYSFCNTCNDLETSNKYILNRQIQSRSYLFLKHVLQQKVLKNAPQNLILLTEEHYINQHQEKKFYFIFLYLYYFLLLFLFHLLILFFISTQIHYMSAINKENLYIYFFNTHTTENCDCRETLYTYFDRENIKHCQ